MTWKLEKWLSKLRYDGSEEIWLQSSYSLCLLPTTRGSNLSTSVFTSWGSYWVNSFCLWIEAMLRIPSMKCHLKSKTSRFCPLVVTPGFPSPEKEHLRHKTHWTTLFYWLLSHKKLFHKEVCVLHHCIPSKSILGTGVTLLAMTSPVLLKIWGHI